MIVKTINFYELSIIPEFFLGITLIYFIIHGLLASFTNKNNYVLISYSIVYLSILCLTMVCFLVLNDNLVNLNFINFCNTFSSDFLSFFTKIVICTISASFLLLIQQQIIIQQINLFEYVIIILFAILGLLLLCSANDLITAYLAIELQSLAFYMLAAFKKNSTYSIESGLKYFILGAFSSSLLLFGCSLIYGISGSINFEALKDLMVFKNNIFLTNPIILMGLMFIFISLFFKLAVAPFNFWLPDVYENSPSSSTMFFAIMPKISIFVLLIRLSYYSFFIFINEWQDLLLIVGILTVFIGSLGGLEQRKFKSLLAYSSISHMGYLLIPFNAGIIEGLQVLFIYIIVYMSSSLCIWCIFMLLRLKNFYIKKQNKDLGDLVLLQKSNKTLAIILSTSLFSIAGLPPMVGFFVKLNIFLIAVKKSLYLITLISIILSVISTFFYLRIIKILFLEPVLVGCLYYPINNEKAIIVSILFFLFLFIFVNPSLLFLISYKINILFL